MWFINIFIILRSSRKCFRVEIYYCISLQIQIIASASPAHNGGCSSQLDGNERRLVDKFSASVIASASPDHNREANPQRTGVFYKRKGLGGGALWPPKLSRLAVM